MEFLIIIISSGLFMLFLIWAQLSPLQVGPMKAQFINKMQEEQTQVHQIKIMTWNFSYGYGVGSEGGNYQKKSKAEYINKLDQAAQLIQECQADVIFLQEIDIASARTYFIDQAQYLAEKLGNFNIAYAPSWELNYVPYPYWPVKDHFGKVKSGGAIISRFPILENDVFLFQKPKTNSWWYNRFYLFRYMQTAKIKIAHQELRLMNIHLEAFDQKSREEQALILKENIKKYSPLIVAGDFNTTPLHAIQKSGFADYPHDNYENDKTLEYLVDIPMSEVSANDSHRYEGSWFTFPSNKKDRKLDYVFFQKHLTLIEAKVVHQNISDHHPILAQFSFEK
jgi:endonuclease/exonuclease/phosphatase family metal-dependent hydrolase